MQFVAQARAGSRELSNLHEGLNVFSFHETYDISAEATYMTIFFVPWPLKYI